MNLGGVIVDVEVPTPPVFRVVVPTAPVVEVFPVGGPPGPPGPTGPSGNTYRYTQGTPAATWNITHNLGKHPSVVIVLSGEGHVYSDITYIDDNHLSIEFPSPVTGVADM